MQAESARIATVRTIVAIFASTSLVASALADVPPKPGVKYIPVTTQFEIDEPFDDYVFLEANIEVPAYRRGTPSQVPLPDPPKPSFSRPSVIDFRPDRPLRLSSGGHLVHHVYAVPRDVYEQAQNKEELRASIQAGKIPGANWQLCEVTEEVRTEDTRSTIVHRYRIEKSRSTNELVFTRFGEDDSNVRSPGEAVALWVVIALTATVVVTVLGLLLFSKRRAPRT